MAAGNLGAASLWIHRAYRLAPMDSTVQILFASIAIHSNPAKAVAMLDALTRRLPWHREAAMAHSAALLRSGRNDEAARSLGTMLVRMSPPGTDMFAGLADAICAANGLPGWVALDGDGQPCLFGPCAAVCALGAGVAGWRAPVWGCALPRG
jgi:hypothetical protein